MEKQREAQQRGGNDVLGTAAARRGPVMQRQCFVSMGDAKEEKSEARELLRTATELL